MGQRRPWCRRRRTGAKHGVRQFGRRVRSLQRGAGGYLSPGRAQIRGCGGGGNRRAHVAGLGQRPDTSTRCRGRSHCSRMGSPSKGLLLRGSRSASGCRDEVGVVGSGGTARAQPAVGAEAMVEVNSEPGSIAGGAKAAEVITLGGWEAAGGKASGGGCCAAGGGGSGVMGTSVRARYAVRGKFHSERWNPVRSDEGSSGGVRALGGCGGEVKSKGNGVPGSEELRRGSTGES